VPTPALPPAPTTLVMEEQLAQALERSRFELYFESRRSAPTTAGWWAPGADSLAPPEQGLLSAAAFIGTRQCLAYDVAIPASGVTHGSAALRAALAERWAWSWRGAGGE
jgi:hypothetical protein